MSSDSENDSKAKETPKSAVLNLAENTESLEVENFIDTYQITAEWIRFADAKATVVLTVSGVLASMLIPSLKPFFQQAPDEHIFTWWPMTAGVLFAGWLICTCISCIWAFLCVHPFRLKGRHPALKKCAHFHAAAISHRYSINDSDQFIQDCEDLGMAGLKQEVMAGLLIDSHISNSKYHRVTESIKMLGISAVFGLLYTLAIQF